MVSLLSSSLLSSVVSHYHRTLLESPDDQQHLAQRGITDPELIKAFQIGFGNRTLLDKVPATGDLRDALKALGIVTERGAEALAGCIVVPLPDPETGEWVGLYGRHVDSGRDVYAPGEPTGILNFQAAKASGEVILAGSVLDAIVLYEAGIGNAIPLYGPVGLTAAHLDLLKREGIRSVTLFLPNSSPSFKAKPKIKKALTEAGVEVHVAAVPNRYDNVQALVRVHGPKATTLLRGILGMAGANLPPVPKTPVTPAMTPEPDGKLRIQRGEVTYVVQPFPVMQGRLRAMIRAERDCALHLDTIDLYASRARADFARKAAPVLGIEAAAVEADLVAVLVECERYLDAEKSGEGPEPAPMSDAERDEALTFLRRPDLLDQIAEDMDVLGYVGEDRNKRLLYLVSISRKLASPLSAIILSQSGAGKSGLSDVIERLTPEEDVLFLTRLSPQSLFYSAPELINRKLIIIEERAGSAEVDYPVRAIQSRGRLTVATPSKDPDSGETKTRTFCVQAQVAFIESTTDSDINPENGSRCFEISMDESQDQTRRIHDRQRLMKTEAGLDLRRKAKAITRRHANAQRLLHSSPVLIPYATHLTFPTTWMRTRRDNARFLNLIEVSAFLHQYQRERKDGAIVASIEDYRVAYALSASVLAETLTDLKRPLREALARVRALAQQHRGPLTRREIREALQVPDTTARRWLKELVELEYLAVVDAGAQGQGKTSRYGVVEGPLNKDAAIPGLLTPEQLETATSPQTAKPPAAVSI